MACKLDVEIVLSNLKSWEITDDGIFEIEE